MQPRGRLIGLGVGPGDPELITVKALRLLRESPVVAYFVAKGKKGTVFGGKNEVGITISELLKREASL